MVGSHSPRSASVVLGWVVTGALALVLAGCDRGGSAGQVAVVSPATPPAVEPPPEPEPIPEPEPPPPEPPAPPPPPAEEPEPIFEPQPLSTEDPGHEVRDLAVQVLSTKSVKLSWTTPHRADTEVRWGKTVALEGTPVLQPERVLAHWVVLTPLEPGQTYFCQALSRTAAGTTAASKVVQVQTLSVEPYAVRATHPRIFFTQDDLPRLRDRIRTTHARQWTELVRACNAYLSKTANEIATNVNNYEYGRAFAFAGLLGQNATFRQKALDIALECARLGATGDKMDIRRRMMAMACIYDWNFDTIPSASRTTIRNGIVSHSRVLEADCNDSEYVWGHSHGNRRPILLGVLAVHGETADAPAKLQELIDVYRDGYLASWRSWAEEGGSLKGWWYTSWTMNMEVEFLSALQSATGLDWHEPWFESVIGWYVDAVRADNTFLRGGDTFINKGLNTIDWVYALNLVHHYGNGKAKWLAEKVIEANGEWDLLHFYDILWNDPSVAAVPPGGSSSRHYRTPGVVIMRDSWLPDAVVATFKSATDYTTGHSHLDNNSFTLFCRGGLALDSGGYTDFNSPHHRNYSTRTIAHNSILVHDPAETFVIWGDVYANDGGQRWKVKGVDVPSYLPATVEQVLDPRNGYRAGGVSRYEDTDEFTWSLGQAASSYSSAKVRRFDRSFLWLKSVAGTSRPVSIVFDEVESTKSSFKKTYLLHTQNAPTVQGTVVTATQNGGSLTQVTLLPASPAIAVVGGSGKEFLVGTTNYLPTKGIRLDEEPGQYRVEISPSAASLSDRFLHVLHAGLVGEKAPPAALVAASGLTGLTVGDWAVLFGSAIDGVRTATYTVSGGAKHLIVGVVPHATYDISVDGTLQTQVVASGEGTLRFDGSVGGRFDISVASQTQPEGGEALLGAADGAAAPPSA